MKCSTCEFWITLSDEERKDAAFGKCCRFPARGNSPENVPVTPSGYWCHEYRPAGEAPAPGGSGSGGAAPGEKPEDELDLALERNGSETVFGRQMRRIAGFGLGHAIKYGVGPIEEISSERLALIFRDQRGLCASCGDPLDVSEIIRSILVRHWNRGGQWTPENIRFVHGRCTCPFRQELDEEAEKVSAERTLQAARDAGLKIQVEGRVKGTVTVRRITWDPDSSPDLSIELREEIARHRKAIADLIDAGR